MAFSSEKKARSLAGNLIIEVHSWNAASVTSGSISTGVPNILHISLKNDVTEANGQAIATGQKVDISSVTANDTGSILVVGY